MTYSLIQLAPGAYDLFLNGELLASVVRNGTGSKNTSWTAELLEDLPRSKRPAPFKEIEHQFPTLEELCAWLGKPQVKVTFERRAVA
jgi:hypothetical protein